LVPDESVLLVAPVRSYRLAAYCEAAQALGIRLVLASAGTHALVPPGVAGIAVDPAKSESALAEVVEFGRQHQVKGVVASDDSTVELACQVARILGLNHNPPSSVQWSRRKDLARARLTHMGAKCPKYWTVRVNEPLTPQLSGVEFPCVVKPVALSGSRGVIRCDDASRLDEVVRRSAAIAAESSSPADAGAILIEEFLPGQEVAVEGMLVAGQLHVLAIFDKPEPLDGPYFEETFYITPTRMPCALQQAVLRRVRQAVDAFGLREGPIHAELRVLNGDATVLEVAARTIGGDCARLLRFGAGRTLEQLVLLHAVNKLELPVVPIEGAGGVLMLPTQSAGTLRRVEGVLAASKVPGIDEVVIAVREGYELVPLPEGSSYLGFVFARGSDPSSVEQALRTALSKLRVVSAPSWRITMG
jgi:biotin carboxylase